jgi:hypothetical protein
MTILVEFFTKKVSLENYHIEKKYHMTLITMFSILGYHEALHGLWYLTSSALFVKGPN